MQILSAIYLETSLIGFVRDAILDLLAKHHLIAAHVVVHAIFKLGHKGFHIDQIEINEVISRDLYSYVSFDVVNEASDSYGMIQLPLSDAGNFIGHLFEKEDSTGASGNKGLSLDQHHLA